MGEMEGDSDKVFVSKINRRTRKLTNNFQDILQKEVKEPLKLILKNEDQHDCEFKPRVNKYYVPKKKSKLKVFTVREIRNLYEKEIYETLPLELERQEKYLLRKIRGGFFKDENTKNIALKLIKSDKPISRTSWQMLMNLNPIGHTHSSQYILWNGQCIQINGSKGGKSKFIYNYDVKNNQDDSRKALGTKRKNQTRRALLRDSLNIRFKPGPLQKKKDLDDSYQRYNVGEIKVVKLPEIGLHIQPSYGTALEPKITTFLQNMRALDGTISEKWAEFAGSALGKATEEGAKIGTEKSIIFNLNYKYDQKRILMRNSFDSIQDPDNDNACRPLDVPLTTCNDDSLTRDIKHVIGRMLDSVEISLNQHAMYSGEDEPREISDHNRTLNFSGIQVKEKEKKRKYCELDRLDVTVIRISEKSKRKNSEPCQQLFCSLGCVCDSLECTYQIKDHCGKIECMFGCNCDFTKFKIADSLEGNCSEFIPGLVYLDKKINGKLAKEEQKFHQTVIVTDDKSILLKSRRRNWKTSKKYADFYSNMPLRTDNKNQKFPEIIISKLNCDNIEPWCMVHNLYKCFCKGKFVRSCVYDSSDVDTIPTMAYKDRGAVPILERTLPVLEKTPPVLEKKLPVLVKTLPVLDKTLPVLEKTLPVLEKTIPVLEKTLPVLEKTLPVLKKTIPVLEQILPVLEKTEPVLEKTEPVLEKTLPVLEKTKSVLEKTPKCSKKKESIKSATKSIVDSSDPVLPDFLCARIFPFHSRKFSEEYYRGTNEKICEMEKNDKNLHTKLVSLIKDMAGTYGSEQTDGTETPDIILDVTDEALATNENIKSPIKTINSDDGIQSPDSLCARMLPFGSRTYSDRYYRKKNKNISMSEKKDKTLQSKLMSLSNIKVSECNQTDGTQTEDEILDVDDGPINPNECNAFFEQKRLANASASVSKIENKHPKTKLVKWLENNLTKDFLDTIEKGNWTTSLSCPNLGKVALYPWKFILSRYRERKNLFLLTTQRPFRIFMAVTKSCSFFANCINVSDIPISSIGEYPDMVRSLINNVSHDNFCILSGLSQCWELVGSVNKVNKEGENKTNSDSINESMDTDESSNDSKDVKRSNICDDKNVIDVENDTNKLSKWFIMTIEDDVNELRFFKKGFFVKYDSLIRSINIARKVGRTVRLAAQTSDHDGNGPRFGIYATPEKNANVLFIGPYEEHELLGIETARNSDEICDGQKTGGLWITVKKIDNLKVTNDPLSFLPSIKNDSDSVVTLDSDTDSDSDSTKKNNSLSSENADLSNETSSLCSDTKANAIKLIKPIRIRKTDSFYHAASRSLLKTLAFTKGSQQSNKVPDGNNKAPLGPFSFNKVPVKPLDISQLGSFENKSKSLFNKPVAEIAPQIKISNISSLCSNSPTTQLTINKRKSEGMFVLKPEEINKRLANNYFRILEPIEIEDNSTEEILSTDEKRLDVEEFLDSSVICTTTSDVYVISDEEDDNSGMIIESVIQNVWIICVNIPNIGWILGWRSNEKKLSFEFPGFAISDYYDEEEALDKINQLFSRKVCIPKNVHPKWQVIETEEELHEKRKLCIEDLNSDFILTRRGLIHKDKLIKNDQRNRKENNHGESEFEGHTSEDHSFERRTSEEDSFEGRSSEGQSSEGRPCEGNSSEKLATEGRSPEGHLPEGHLPEGHLPEGHSSEGRSPEGHSSQGRSSEGHSSEVRSSEARSSKGRSSERRSSEGRLSERRSSERRSSEGRMELEASGSEKIINVDNLSNKDNVQGNVTAIASTSIDADGNDRGIKIYRITHHDPNEKAVDENPSQLDEFIASEVEYEEIDIEMDDIQSRDENTISVKCKFLC